MDLLNGCVAKVDGFSSAVEEGADELIGEPCSSRASIREQGAPLHLKKPGGVVKVNRDISNQRGWACGGE